MKNKWYLRDILTILTETDEIVCEVESLNKTFSLQRPMKIRWILYCQIITLNANVSQSLSICRRELLLPPFSFQLTWHSYILYKSSDDRLLNLWNFIRQNIQFYILIKNPSIISCWKIRNLLHCSSCSQAKYLVESM